MSLSKGPTLLPTGLFARITSKPGYRNYTQNGIHFFGKDSSILRPGATSSYKEHIQELLKLFKHDPTKLDDARRSIVDKLRVLIDDKDYTEEELIQFLGSMIVWTVSCFSEMIYTMFINNFYEVKEPVVFVLYSSSTERFFLIRIKPVEETIEIHVIFNSGKLNLRTSGEIKTDEQVIEKYHDTWNHAKSLSPEELNSFILPIKWV